MIDENATKRVIDLQSRLQLRLDELGFADSAAVSRMSRHLAEICILGHQLGAETVPLFLSINREHADSLSALATSMKVAIEHIGDAISDVTPDMLDLVEFLRPSDQ